MKQIKQIGILLLVILFTVTCKKEHVLASTTGTPEFYFKGTVNGVATDLNAGLNNYYMYSSYARDSNNIYNFIGNIKQINSNLNSIEIEINDYKVSAINGNAQIDSSLTPGNYVYYIPGTGTTSTAYKTYFYANTANGTPQNYNWTFGDGQSTQSSVPNITHIYTTGNYTANLTVNFAGGCSSSASNPIKGNANGVLFNATAFYVVDTTNPNILNFSAKVNKFASAYIWNFGDGSSPINTNSSPSHTYSTSAAYTVSLTAIDSLSNNSAVVNLNVVTGGFMHCLTNFTDSMFATTINTTSALSKVIINYTDALGNVYTSKNSVQPASSNFQIISVDNYQNNNNDQHTKKLHVKFNCLVYNSTLPSIQIANADAVIAVAYK